MSYATMHDLLLHELRDLYHAEGQISQALPKLARKAHNRALVTVLSKHLRETEEQETRLEQCFQALDVSSKGKRCKGMEGLLAEADEMIEQAENDEVRDAAIIGACQKVEHYEISGYGTARAFAEHLGLEEVTALLTETLEEESSANERLTEVANAEVNAKALETDGEPARVESSSRRGRASSAEQTRRQDSQRREGTAPRRH